jgi:FixJ family two-component response regulator
MAADGLMPNKSTVLILVDDDEAVLAAMTFAFRVEGYEVRAYPDAESLLAETELPKEGCLILDYRLPGEDGLALLRRLRQRGVAIPAVMISTPSRSFLALAAADHVPVVEKPLIAGRLLETVRELLQA